MTEASGISSNQVALVILPGLDGTGWLLQDFAASFGAEVKPIVASYPRDVPLAYDELEPIARSFMPTDMPFFILGESFSGPLAVSIAASQPTGLLGVILCCTFVRSPHPYLSKLMPLISAIPMATVPVPLLSFFLGGRYSSPMIRSMIRNVLSQVTPKVLKARARAALSIDVSALVPHIDVPMLYLLAAEDRVIPKSNSAQVIALAPSTQVIEFPAPHMLLQLMPLEASLVIKQFMRSCQDSAS